MIASRTILRIVSEVSDDDRKMLQRLATGADASREEVEEALEVLNRLHAAGAVRFVVLTECEERVEMFERAKQPRLTVLKGGQA